MRGLTQPPKDAGRATLTSLQAGSPRAQQNVDAQEERIFAFQLVGRVRVRKERRSLCP
jgi:hypothetical protein